MSEAKVYKCILILERACEANSDISFWIELIVQVSLEYALMISLKLISEQDFGIVFWIPDCCMIEGRVKFQGSNEEAEAKAEFCVWLSQNRTQNFSWQVVAAAKPKHRFDLIFLAIWIQDF